MSRARAWVVVTAFVGALVVSLLTPWLQRDRATLDALVQAASRLSTVARRGDVVMVHPPWRDDVIDELHRRALFARGVLVTEGFAPRHGGATPRIYVVRDDGFALPASLASRTHDVVESGEHVEVLRFEPQPPSASASPERRR